MQRESDRFKVIVIKVYGQCNILFLSVHRATLDVGI